MSDLKLPPFTIQSEINPNEIPWGIKHINAPKVWESNKGENVVVAILDTGCDVSHPDLAGRVLDGRNFTPDYNGDTTNYHDNQGHGTHCAGVVAGVINNDGVVGVAPETKLIIGKVLSGTGGGSYDSIINGIKWATKWVGPNGETVRIISMSLGGPENTAILYKAIKEAVDKGISVVCAAGNNGDANHNTNEYAYPGAYGIVIEVGASDKLDQVASFSNTNNRIDVVAPGVDILSTMPNGLWARMSGTSMATPHVTGALALIISTHESQGQKLTEMEAYELLLKHVRPLPYAKNAVGHGIVDLVGLKVEKIESQPMPITKSIPITSVFAEEDKHFVNVGPFDTKEQANEMFISIKKLLKNNS